jgi:hypothetical protein
MLFLLDVLPEVWALIVSLLPGSLISNFLSFVLLQTMGQAAFSLASCLSSSWCRLPLLQLSFCRPSPGVALILSLPSPSCFACCCSVFESAAIWLLVMALLRCAPLCSLALSQVEGLSGSCSFVCPRKLSDGVIWGLWRGDFPPEVAEVFSALCSVLSGMSGLDYFVFLSCTLIFFLMNDRASAIFNFFFELVQEYINICPYILIYRYTPSVPKCLSFFSTKIN